MLLRADICKSACHKPICRKMLLETGAQSHPWPPVITQRIFKHAWELFGWSEVLMTVCKSTSDKSLGGSTGCYRSISCYIFQIWHYARGKREEIGYNLCYFVSAIVLFWSLRLNPVWTSVPASSSWLSLYTWSVPLQGQTKEEHREQKRQYLLCTTGRH